MPNRDDHARCQNGLFRRLALVVAALAVLSVDVDASEPIGAGGLQIAVSPGLVIEASETTVTPTQVRHIYRVRNRGRSARSAFVTFVMPELDRYSLAEDGGWRSLRDPVNIVAATTRVNGRTIDLKAQQRALALGLDVTAQIANARLTLMPLDPNLDLQISKLDAATSADLVERGILQIDDGRARPGWVLHTTAYWRQQIEPGAVTVIEHTYTPLAGVQPLSQEALERAVERACLEPDRAARLRTRVATTDAPVLTFVHLLQSTVSGQEPPEVSDFKIEVPTDGLETSVCLGPLTRPDPQTLAWQSRQGQIERDLTVLFVRGRPGR